ncbi:alpha-tectorin-like [Clavelina lepadiformis]|uniref:alpha-tectorin-like n=1 Tax=Clavelina lepadiformis TaxID=159417 RepID=UPI0040425891
MEGIECSGNPLISLTSDQLLSLGLQPGGRFIVSRQSSQSVENSEEADERCIGSYEDPSLTMNITSCSAVLEDTGTFIKVTYTVQSLLDLGDFPIARHKDNCLNVTCFLQKEILIKSNEIVPEIRKILLPVQTFEGDLRVTIEFYQDDTFGEILEENSNVFVMDYINVGISFVNPVEEAFILQATRCWATLTPNAGAPYVYVIIDDSCPAHNEFDETGSIDVVQNYQSNSVYFRFKAFVWTGVSLDSQAIYVHCAVTVCYNDTTSHCTDLSCPVSRKRRNSENDIMTATVSSKPIFLQTKEPICLKDNGGCSDVCDMREGKVVCSCRSGRKILEDGKSCQAAIARARDDTAMHFVLGIRGLELQKLYGFILLVVLFALVVAFSFWKTRRI